MKTYFHGRLCSATWLCVAAASLSLGVRAHADAASAATGGGDSTTAQTRLTRILEYTRARAASLAAQRRKPEQPAADASGPAEVTVPAVGDNTTPAEAVKSETPSRVKRLPPSSPPAGARKLETPSRVKRLTPLSPPAGAPGPEPPLLVKPAASSAAAPAAVQDDPAAARARAASLLADLAGEPEERELHVTAEQEAGTARARATASRADPTGRPKERERDAAAAKWRVGVGVTHRSLGDVTFASREFRNVGDQFVGTLATGPNDTPANRAAAQGNGPYGEQDLASPLPAAMLVGDLSAQGYGVAGQNDLLLPVDYITANSTSADPSGTDGLGAMLSAERRIVRKGRWTLAVATNLQYFGASISERESGTMASPGAFTAQQYLHSVVNVDNSGLPAGVIAVINPVDAADPNALLAPGDAQFADKTVFSMDNDVDLTCLCLDLGVQAAYAAGRLGLELGLGPTLTLVDLDASQRLSSRWDQHTVIANPAAAPANQRGVTVPAGASSETRSDSSMGTLLGAYVTAGMVYQVTPLLDITANVRYDIVAGDVDNDIAEVELDGYSMQLRLRMRY